MKKIVCFLGLLSVVGCASFEMEDSSSKDLGYSVVQKEAKFSSLVDGIDFVGIVTIQYSSPSTLKEQIEKDSKNEMLTDEQKTKRVSDRSKGGLLSVTFKRKTIDLVSKPCFSYVYQKEGKEERAEAKHDASSIFVPNHYGMHGFLWSAFDIVLIKEEISVGETIKFFVVDKCNSVRDEFLITRNK